MRYTKRVYGSHVSGTRPRWKSLEVHMINPHGEPTSRVTPATPEAFHLSTPRAVAWVAEWYPDGGVIVAPLGYFDMYLGVVRDWPNLAAAQRPLGVSVEAVANG